MFEAHFFATASDRRPVDDFIKQQPPPKDIRTTEKRLEQVEAAWKQKEVYEQKASQK